MLSGIPGALESDAVVDRVVTLLNASPQDAALFAPGFPMERCTRQAPGGLQAAAASTPVVTTTGLRITAPPEGSTVTPGQAVTVTVQPDAGVTPNRMMLVSLGEAQDDAAAPWQFTLQVPRTVVGPFLIGAFGVDAAGAVYGAERTLNVVPTAPLRLLRVAPERIALSTAGMLQSLTVIGSYGDGAQADLTRGRTGTTYASGNPAVAIVDADGRVTGVGNGDTTISVTNGTENATVAVLVRAETDLGISQTPSPNPVAPGQTFAVRIIVSNLGPVGAREVTVENQLPAGSRFVSAGGAGWGCREAGGLVSCSRADLAVGESTPIEIAAVAPALEGVANNSAVVRLAVGDGAVDNNVTVAALRVSSDPVDPGEPFCLLCLPSRGGWRAILR
jgi:uncharacterized repeat protein (TIGR01451 family)